MNKLLKGILAFSLKNKYFIFSATALLAVYGFMTFQKMPIEALRFMTMDASQPATPPTIIAIIQPIELPPVQVLLRGRAGAENASVSAPSDPPTGRSKFLFPADGKAARCALGTPGCRRFLVEEERGQYFSWRS